MKAVIHGLKYDTEHATHLADYRRGAPGDFGAWEESLYRTENGRYFLAGEGGPKTKYATRHPDGGASGGRKVIALTEDEAAEWCESTGNYRVMEDEFASHVEEA